MTVLLTRRAVVQAAIESVYNDPASVGANDGVLVAEPMYYADANVLERNFVRNTLSPQAHIVGRLLSRMEFETELRGSGDQNSGLVADAPIIARLFRACGYALSGFTDPSAIGPFDIGSHANQVAWEVSSGEFASATLTLTPGTPPDIDGTFIAAVGGVYYQWAADPTAGTPNGTVGSPFLVDIGVNDAASLANLVAAINASGTPGVTYSAEITAPHATVEAVATSGTVVTVTALVKGTTGNAIATTKTGAEIAWSGPNFLTGGADIASNTDMIAYYLEVTTGGASATAEITVTSDTAGEGDAAQVVTTATPFAFGTEGLELTPTFTGNLTQGDRWIVWLTPQGLKLQPVSEDFESITLVMNKDGVKHTMPGAFGTFEITAVAGEYAKIQWTFTGTYEAPVDASLESPTYERTLPAQVQLARLRVDEFDAIVEQVTFNQNNDIQIRPDVSSEQGYIGTRIVARAPEGGINPEADLVANYDFWGRLRSATRTPFQMRVGTEAGNTCWMLAPGTQYTGMTYADRNGILTYDAGLKFPAYDADDEIFFFLH